MKTVIVIALTILLFQNGYSQSQKYYQIKGYLQGKGYTVSNEIYGDIAQSESAFYWRRFYANTTYLIYGFTEDDDVNDLDLYVNYDDGDLYVRDNGTDAVPIVTFTPTYDHDMKVLIKNYSSSTPYSKSRCWFFIAYK